MDIEKYKVLLETINLGSITATADKLGYTPSGISRLINNLEIENGFPLLVRNKTGVVPTEACLTILPNIENLLQSAENLSQRSAQICGIETGTITVGSSYNIYYKWLSKIICEFNKLYPHVNFNIVEGTSSDLAAKVENGQADFCIISQRNGNLNWIPLIEDELVVWVSEDHPSIKQGYYELEDLEKERFIQFYPTKETDNSIFLSKMNIHPKSKFGTSDMYAAYSMVEAGLGVCLTNNLFADTIKGNVKTLPLKDPKYINIGIAIPREEALSPATRTFTKFAKNYIEEL